ncbi:ribonuclease J, partial [Candidatus Wolfebacteria bacterium]|nr:ribonuclease J [Candidatus Wolfebacteria bacterium]
MVRQSVRQLARQKSTIIRRKIYSPKKEKEIETSKGEEAVRFATLGGLEEVGRNMMFFEYEDEIIVLDAGLQFPEEATPGIDYIIPNVAYLEERKNKVKAIIITHGHYDHIGAIPYIMDKLGNPPLFTAAITKEIILRRQEDFSKAPKINFEVVKAGDIRQLSKNFKAEFFGVTHNIPDGVGVILETPVGKMVHGGEFKFDYDNEGNPKNLDVWEKIGKQ